MKKKNRSDYYIHSINRAIQILNSLTSKKEMGITELSKKLNLHKSTVYRILITLEDESIVARNNFSQKYRLGMKLFELGNIVKEQIEIKNYALPFMGELAQKTEESVGLSIIMDSKKVYIEKIESLKEIRQIIELGKSFPLYSAASGKCLLAFMQNNKINKIIQEEKLIKLAPNTITDPVILKKQLKQIRREGYAVSIEETFVDSISIAAPILDSTGKSVAAISVYGPFSRFTTKKIHKYILLVKKAAQDISNSIGYDMKKI